VIAAALVLLAAVPGVRVTSEFDKSGQGREILSPAVPRNGWSRFHILISGPAAAPYQLHVGTNPEDIFRTEMRRGGTKVALPFDSLIPRDGGPAVFEMSIWVDRELPIRRVKLEPQVFMEPAGWIVYPMEVRVVEATVPPQPKMPPFCPAPNGALAPTLMQDLALAYLRPGPEAAQRLEKAVGKPSAEWCAKPSAPDERWLAFRDWLLK
jgi:hypothetical protein